MSFYGQPKAITGLPLNTFHYIECGGNPSQRPDLDYSLFLPYLWRTYDLAELSFLSHILAFYSPSQYRAIDVSKLINEIKKELKKKKAFSFDEDLSKESGQTLLDVGSPYMKVEQSIDEEMRSRAFIYFDLVEFVFFTRRFYEPNSGIKATQTMAALASQFPRLYQTIHLRELEHIFPIAVFELDLFGHLGDIGGGEIELKDIVRAVPFLMTADNLIRSLVANNPSIFIEVVNLLVDAYARRIPLEVKIRIQEMLYTLCELGPRHAPTVRSIITKHNILAGLAVKIALKFCGDLVTFIDGALTTKPNWLNTQLLSQPQVVGMLQSRLFEILEKKLGEYPHPNQIDLSILLRIICGFAGVLNVQYKLTELQMCLSIIAYAKSERLVKLCLCFLLVCSEMLFCYSQVRMPSITLDALKQIVEQALRQLIRSEHSHLFLLFAVYFNTGQMNEIRDICQATVGMEIKIPNDGLEELRKIFTRNLFSNEFLAQRALSLEPSTFSNLGVSSDPEHLSLKCFYHLLKAKVFHNSNMDIRDWMTRQICGATIPVHERMGPLLQRYAESILDRDEKNPRQFSPITKIPEKELIRLFQEEMLEVTPAHVLMLMYVLYYNNRVEQLAATGFEISTDRQAYSAELMENIAIRRILSFAEMCGEGKAYREIYPELLILVATNYPEVFDIASFLEDEDRWKTKIWKHSKAEKLLFKQVIEQNVKAVMPHWLDKPEEALAVLIKLETIPPSDLYLSSRTIISSSLPRLLDLRSDKRILDSFVVIWEKLNHVNPHELAAMTLDALRIRAEEGEIEEYPQPLFLLNPVAFLNIEPHIFRCPPIYRIVIQILNFYLIGSRHRFQKDYHFGSPHLKKEFSEKHLRTFLDLQDCTMLLMLLRGCESTNWEDSQSFVLDEIRTLTCNYLHQVFIENSRLHKLVIYQGFDHKLLPIVVERVESMHVCMDYVPELVRHQDPETRNFGILIGSYICQKWPLRVTFAIAKDVMMPIMQDLITHIQPVEINETLHEIYRAAVRIAKVFPVLKKEVINILKDSQKIFSRNIDKSPYTNVLRDTTEMHRKIIDLRELLQEFLEEVETIPSTRSIDEMVMG
ncbi:hypothetical protein G9A89_009037 [Geosiphon pyriformis]|nr:hypothetical protein G9A89_009037 [Geosiphon pyriformis]